jgi:hypothetical protein
MVELPDHFSVHADPDIDRVVAAHVSRVGEEVCRVVGDIRALFLVGGFARGEGSVIVDRDGPRPLNDYDFVIVTETRRYWSSLAQTGQRLAKELGIPAVDLLPLRIRDLPALRHTIFNYDLIACGKLVAGDTSVRNFLPRLLPGHIPLVEGRILLMNRMYCLLESFRHRFLGESPNEPEAFFCHQQGAKAVLACQDAILLQQRRYHHRYLERMLRFQDGPCPVRGLQELSRQATAFKLRPTPVTGEAAVGMWLEGRRVLLAGLQLVTGRSSWDELERAHLARSLRDRLARRLAALRGGGEDPRQALVEIAELRLLVSLGDGGGESGSPGAARLLTEAGFTASEQDGWERLRQRAVDAWMTVTHG